MRCDEETTVRRAPVQGIGPASRRCEGLSASAAIPLRSGRRFPVAVSPAVSFSVSLVYRCHPFSQPFKQDAEQDICARRNLDHCHLHGPGLGHLGAFLIVMKLEAGQPALLIDEKGRHFLLKLDPQRTFQYHKGHIAHSELIGLEDGSWVTASTGSQLLLIRPRLADYILKMKRGAQIVYPKDIGPIMVFGDIGPGLTVLEAGTGSGALTLGLTRAVGPSGRVVTVELREDHAAHARKALERWFGAIPENLTLLTADVTEHVETVQPDRIVLDLPEPGPILEKASEHQPNGGGFIAYLPTIPQVQGLVEQARALGCWAEIEIKEFLFRDWNVSGRSVRPQHEMIGHTGFLVFMRKTEISTD